MPTICHGLHNVICFTQKTYVPCHQWSLHSQSLMIVSTLILNRLWTFPFCCTKYMAVPMDTKPHTYIQPFHFDVWNMWSCLHLISCTQSHTHTHTHYQHTTGPSVLLYKTHSSAYGHETMYSTTACIAQVIHSESFNIAPSCSGPNTNITIITWPICGCCRIAYAHFNVVLLKEWAWIGIDCWCLMVFSYSPFHSVPLHLFNFVYSLWKLSCHQWPFLDVEC
jgi:hypothetical protein